MLRSVDCQSATDASGQHFGPIVFNFWTLRDGTDRLCQNLTNYQSDLFHLPTLMHNFFYSLPICMLHYNPRHVSSINMPIFRRTNCFITASGIVTLCTVQYSMPDESRVYSHPAYSTVVYRE